jgi:hypothetical protein
VQLSSVLEKNQLHYTQQFMIVVGYTVWFWGIEWAGGLFAVINLIAVAFQYIPATKQEQHICVGTMAKCMLETLRELVANMSFSCASEPRKYISKRVCRAVLICSPDLTLQSTFTFSRRLPRLLSITGTKSSRLVPNEFHWNTQERSRYIVNESMSMFTILNLMCWGDIYWAYNIWCDTKD